MLQGLFEDEDGDFVSSEPQGPHISGKKLPPSPRLELRLCGLINQGALCYLNSLIQTLFYTPEFRHGLLSLSRRELGDVDDQPNVKRREIPVQLQALFARMLLSDVSAVTTTALTDSFGWTDGQVAVQQDVQELNRILFSAIEDSLVATPGERFIQDNFHGVAVSQIRCLRCHHTSERDEDFLDVQVPLQEAGCLQDALRQLFCDTEALTGDNQYNCDLCGVKKDRKSVV